MPYLAEDASDAFQSLDELCSGSDQLSPNVLSIIRLMHDENLSPDVEIDSVDVGSGFS